MLRRVEQIFPHDPRRRPWKSRLSPCSPEAWGQQVESPQKHFKSLHWSRFLARGEKFMQEHVFWKELCPMGNPGWSSFFLRDYTSWKGPMLKQFLEHHSLQKGAVHERLSPVGGTPLKQGCSIGREESRVISGVWKEGWWEGGFNFGFVSHFPTLIWIGNKLN